MRWLCRSLHWLAVKSPTRLRSRSARQRGGASVERRTPRENVPQNVPQDVLRTPRSENDNSDSRRHLYLGTWSISLLSVQLR
ncbi:hypothetical protein L209DRAFT_166512 [Thermothelomyces heterothallicus CBS 203.75]